MAKLWKKAQAPSGEPQVQEIDLASLTISSPTIIYLSGYLTTDQQTSYVEESIRSMEELLQGKAELPKLPEIYCWSHTNLRNVFNVAAYNLRPQIAYSDAAELLAKSVIMPLVSEKGKPLLLPEAQKRLRNVTFFGFSAGTVVAQETFNASMEMMQKIGYKQDEARKLLQEVVLISTGTVSHPTKEKNRFTTLYLAGSNDLYVRWKNRLWSPLQHLFQKYARKLTIKPLSETSLLITAAIRKRLWRIGKAADGTPVKEKIRRPFPRCILPRANHELPDYITCDDGNSEFSKIVLHGLINAANRTGKPDVMKLLDPLSSHKPEEIAAYRDRIQKAIIQKKK